MLDHLVVIIIITMITLIAKVVDPTALIEVTVTYCS